jgi:hypothetical protein
MCESSDPINLLFIDTELADIDSVFRNAHWCQPSGQLLAGDQFIDKNCSWKQDRQWTDSSSVVQRFHVRLWRSGNNVIGSAHYETLHAFRGHVVFHFEGAKKLVSNVFSKAGWKTRDGQRLDNQEYIRYNEGIITEIMR